MFSILAQRGHRWFRFDPMGALAFIRLADQLPTKRGQGANPHAATLRLNRWRYAGMYFETGPWLGFNVTNPVEEQIDWLARERPRNLATYSESLEHLCMATGGVTPADSIEATLAISEQLTPSMRQHVERTFAAPVSQFYGLNEIGLVAVRCTAGRYHVHTEHCFVEVVDDNGQPAAPGSRGRIAVTALNNLAMPLLRYDTDDMAEAVDGP
jgi:phenylacetate-CoA ligase